MSQAVRFRVRQVGHVAVVDLEGDLTHDSETPLQAAMRDPHVSSRGHVLLNFSPVGYINSAGISLLVSLIAGNRENPGKLIACSLSPHYEKIFRMVGLSSYLPTFDSESAALQALETSAPA